MIEIDGSMGEGGGQILRTSLSLALATRRPLHIRDIRANRGKPGLRRQHLTAVRAAAAVSDAEVEGAEMGSEELVLKPRAIQAGDYEFDIQTAGSTVLVLQTVLPALATVEEPSAVSVAGGTHNLHAPIFEFVDTTYRAVLRQLGARVRFDLHSHGFYPAGGGRVTARLEAPLARDAALDLDERGDIRTVRATSLLAKLPDHIAEREFDTLAGLLDAPLDDAETERIDDSRSPGNVLYVQVDSDALTETFSVIGRKGLPAERVARKLARQVNAYLASEAPVGPHLADQLLLPMALCGGGSYRTREITTHTETQIELIPKFMPVDIRIDAENGRDTIRVSLEHAS